MREPIDRARAAEIVLSYHERTKHNPDRYARSAGYLDWPNEPNPFRRYEGVDLVRLPLLEKDTDSNHSALYDRRGCPAKPFTLDTIAAFLELSLGLSAWKSFQTSRWALRMNPSSGNLHPTEAYLVLPPMPGLHGQGGIFHYNPFFHALEPRARFGEEIWSVVRGHFHVDCLLAGLSSIFWRESWKYGERAFRYCNLDVGHAAACLSFSASLQGWRVVWLQQVSDREIRTVLGFDKTAWKAHEEEHPDQLFLVHRAEEAPGAYGLAPEAMEWFSTLHFFGEPSQLSRGHADWRVIDEAASAAEKPSTPLVSSPFSARDRCADDVPLANGAVVIRQRRSAQAYDPEAGISKKAFLEMLERTIPHMDHAPFDVGLGGVSVNLLLFVHRVAGLDAGLYFLVRDEKDFEEIKQSCSSELLWQRVPETPESVRLYLLRRGDFRRTASALSCHQDIAGDSAFSLGMLARFRKTVEEDPYLYRVLHWECGMIGQVLYLEAETHSLRGTGIGCFFDDLVHKLLGIADDSYQTLYHFTVGKPLEDPRLTTLPPYDHLKQH